MSELDRVITSDVDWLLDQVGNFTTQVLRVLPSQYNEEHRYLPASVSPIEGPLSFDVNPFAREIVDCFDVDSPVREVNIRKGVQITYTTILECILLYFIGHVKSAPCAFFTADAELAQGRIEANILPMLHESGFADVIKSADVGNKRKTGKTKKLIQWEGGGFLLPGGANNATKFRQWAILLMLKDEIDAWPLVVGKDGDPDALTDDRCASYWQVRKILRGGTPLIRGTSKIDKNFERGDQRYYMVRCLSCGFQQALRWSGKNKDTGETYGYKWELENGTLIHDSVRYECANCNHAHHEYDKDKLFSPDHGAQWVPTARPSEPFIRSYHLPAFYSPVGMQPWYKSVAMWLEAWNEETNSVKDIGKLQVFYNNVMAESFEVRGARITKQHVSGHKRAEYNYGSVPNVLAEKYCTSPIAFLTCQVDVHKSWIQTAVMGWTRGCRCFLIDYQKFEDNSENGCEDIESPVWEKLAELIEQRLYLTTDGKLEYNIDMTVIDAGYIPDTVSQFCSQYASGVYPIIGRDRPAKYQRIKEFDEYTMQNGVIGYRVLVDHYKDRIAPVLRRDWQPEQGNQLEYQYNVPSNCTKQSLDELTRERRTETTDDRGNTTYQWTRTGARNEMWDLLVYGHAAVEIMAWLVCVRHYEMKTVDWARFWSHWLPEESE